MPQFINQPLPQVQPRRNLDFTPFSRLIDDFEKKREIKARNTAMAELVPQAQTDPLGAASEAFRSGNHEYGNFLMRLEAQKSRDAANAARQDKIFNNNNAWRQKEFDLKKQNFNQGQTLRALNLDLKRAELNNELSKAKEVDPLIQSKIDLNRARIKNITSDKSHGFDGLSSTDKKALYAAEDELPSLEGAIKDLERARKLLPKTNTAFAPEFRATIGNAFGVDEESSAATTEYAQLMGLQTFQIMSKLLKGAMSDREMAQFQKIIGDTSAPHSVRKNALDRMIGMAKDHLSVKKRRIGELRGVPADNNLRNDLIKQAREAISKGADKNKVKQRLLEKLSKGDF